ncbi:MAG: tetratricopeptide repeat protein [Planctomycetota bacterium]
MTQQKQQSDLSALSREWFDRVKDIRQKARDENDQPDAGHTIESASLDGINIANILPDSDLFAAPVGQEVGPDQIFAGPVDTELFKPAQKPVRTPSTQSEIPELPTINPIPAEVSGKKIERRRSNWVLKVVAASLLVIAGILIYGVIRLPKMFGGGGTADYKLAQQDTDQAGSVDASTGGDYVDDGGSVSLQSADDAFFSGQFVAAGLSYKKLIGKVSANLKDDILIDFLRLRMALCLKETDGPDKALGQLKVAANSYSPTIRMMAHFYSAQIEMERQQYLAARRNACASLALVDTVYAHQPWCQQLRRNCHFLIAATISEQSLSLSNDDRNVPDNMWKLLDAADDPFAGLHEKQLRTLLIAGSEKLRTAMLGPRIKADISGHVRQWSITCDGASVDELLNRFGASGGYDIHWTPGANKAGIRQRAIQMHLPVVTDEQATAMIAGCAGLLAVIGDDQVITIYNLAEYNYVSEHIKLLGNRAISRWRQFLLAFHEDRYLPNVHLALGLLYAQQGLASESMAEYKIVANRFPHSPQAPVSLYNSGMLKAGLLDYTGAYENLQSLVEQYPDCPLVSQAYLSLADMTAKTGDEAGAASLYRKIYYLNASVESRAVAALKAGEIYYRMGDYIQAKKWLSQHVDSKKGFPDKNYYHAYYMLGKTRLAMGETDAACIDLNKAVRGELPKAEYVEALTAFVEACMKSGHFVLAFDLLEETYLSQFSQGDSVKLMILKSRLLRTMGLTDKAVTLLRDRLDYITNSSLKAQMGYELSLCYIDLGELELAAKKLAHNLELSAPGDMTHQSSLLLAKICLQLDRGSQARTLCENLLTQNTSDDIRQEVIEMLALMHSDEKNYDNAALVLMGQVK